MQFPMHFRAVRRPGSSNRVAGNVPITFGARLKKGGALVLVAWLWNLPHGNAWATELAPPAGLLDPSAASDASPMSTDAAAPEAWNLHGQATFTRQYHPSFTSPYQGTNSLTPGRNGEETTDVTLYLGVRVWVGGALYVNPEIDEGFGLSNTLGVAGYVSGEANRVGKDQPVLHLPRIFLRQRFDLGGESTTLTPGANELGGTQTADNVTLTVGKFSVVDIFDTNRYAHDPRGDFLNWSIIDAGAFDYAADAWGYTVGAAAEWTQSWWTLRGGFFDLSDVPNSKQLEAGFKEFQVVGEFEGRYALAEHPGKLKLLGFLSYGRMGKYDDAVRLGQETGAVPDTSLVRHYTTRPGVALNLEQEIAPNIGAFARLSFNDGSKEEYDFTDVNRSLSGGISIMGAGWNRADDTFGLAGAVNEISAAAQSYFAAGGLGGIIGDGQLPHPRSERILETYYSMRVAEHFTITAEYQYVVNPAYNPDRGPVNIFGLRLHAEF